MPGKRFIRNSEWQRQPHVKDGAPPSLWWHARPDRRRVIDAYVSQCKRGRAVPEGFKDDLVQWLDDLSSIQNKKPLGRTFRYWDIPSYARAHKMKPASLMKRVREMEKLAAQLFPDSVPTSRKPHPQLSDQQKQAIRERYLAGEDCKTLAEEFRIPPAHVGLLCRKEKAIRDAARQQLIDAHNAPTGGPESGDPETGGPVEPY